MKEKIVTFELKVMVLTRCCELSCSSERIEQIMVKLWSVALKMG